MNTKIIKYYRLKYLEVKGHDVCILPSNGSEKKPIKYTHINMDRKYKENTEEKQEFIS